MLARGYLWQDLRAEIEEEFAQPHPFVQAYDSIPFWLKHGWHIEGALGDMSGIRKSRVQRRGEVSTPSVRSLRARRKAEGKCTECERFRHPRSKNYCARHREADRKRAEAKRVHKRSTR